MLAAQGSRGCLSIWWGFSSFGSRATGHCGPISGGSLLSAPSLRSSTLWRVSAILAMCQRPTLNFVYLWACSQRACHCSSCRNARIVWRRSQQGQRCAVLAPSLALQPLRTASHTHAPSCCQHCHDCNRCVRLLDHHCWWLGNCVGAANHRIFISYLLCQAMLICSFGIAIAFGGDSSSPPLQILSAPSAVACTLMSTVLGLLSLSLLLFQCVLIARGETTWEHLRRERINKAAGWPPQVRPYDYGPVNNCLRFALGARSTVQARVLLASDAKQPPAPSSYGL